MQESRMFQIRADSAGSRHTCREKFNRRLFKCCLLLIGLFPSILASASLYANEIENKFVEAGLVDVHAVDQSIKVDLVNSDPDKNFFRQNYYNGLWCTDKEPAAAIDHNEKGWFYCLEL